MADKKKKGSFLKKLAAKLPDRMLSKFILKMILKSKIDISNEIYQIDFRNFSLKVNYDICGVLGNQTFTQTDYFSNSGENIQDADVSISIESLDVFRMILRGDSYEPGVTRDSDNNLVYTHTTGIETIETEHGPHKQPIKVTFFTVKISDPEKHNPFVITKIPFFRGFIKQRDIEVDGEEYGSYIPINLSAGKYENEVIPLVVFEHFINKASNIILKLCGCRKYFNCENHPIELGCMYMGDDTFNMVFPSDVGYVATKEEALERVKIAIKSGLIPLLGRYMMETELQGIEDTGHCLSCCFCCSCCCTNGRQITGGSHLLLGEMAHRMKGVEVKVDESKCVGCGTCLEVCVFKGMEMVDGKAQVNPDFCLGCGRCVEVCPNGAPSISIEDPSYINQLIAKIESVVDVTPQTDS